MQGTVMPCRARCRGPTCRGGAHPKPLERPVVWSNMTCASSMAPNCSKYSLSISAAQHGAGSGRGFSYPGAATSALPATPPPNTWRARGLLLCMSLAGAHRRGPRPRGRPQTASWSSWGAAASASGRSALQDCTHSKDRGCDGRVTGSHLESNRY